MIKQIRIQNFRSLVDVTVDLDPLTVLIGRSGTGKSNFVHAIRFLRDCLNSRQVLFDQLGGPHRIFHVDHRNEPLEYRVQFTITGFPQPFEYLLRIQPNAQVMEESLRIGVSVLFHQGHNKWIHAPAVTPTPGVGGIKLGAIPGLQESTFAYVALRSGIGCYDFPGDVLVGIGNQGQPLDIGFADRGDNYLLVADRILSDLSKAQNWKRIAKSMRPSTER